MALLLSLLSALLLLSCGPGGSLGCHLPQHRLLLSGDSLVLLSQMSTMSPLLCLKDRKDFRFPRPTVEGREVQGAQAATVLHELLQQVFNLLLTAPPPAAWNTTLLGQLGAGLHRQLGDLHACLGQGTAEEGSALATRGPARALKRYFQGIRLYLKGKGHSDCAWEVVRVEVMKAFSSARTLQERLSDKDRDLPPPGNDPR